MKFEGVEILLQEGDVLTSKKGFLQVSPVTKKSYLVHKQEYMGNGFWKVIGDKIEVNSKPLKQSVKK
jgi:hypothetical protein